MEVIVMFYQVCYRFIGIIFSTFGFLTVKIGEDIFSDLHCKEKISSPTRSDPTIDGEVEWLWVLSESDSDNPSEAYEGNRTSLFIWFSNTWLVMVPPSVNCDPQSYGHRNSALWVLVCRNNC